MSLFKTKSYSAEEIQQGFKKAGEDLLMEVKKIIHATDKAIFDRRSVLNSLGFTGVPVPKVNVADPRSLASVSTIRDAVQVATIRYPGYTFLTNEQFVMLCKKYGLVDHAVCLFKADVPAKNLMEIEEFINKFRMDLTLGALQVYGLSWWGDTDKSNYRDAAIRYCESFGYVIPGSNKFDAGTIMMRALGGSQRDHGSQRYTVDFPEAKATTTLKIAAPANMFAEPMIFDKVNPFHTDKIHDPIVTYPFGIGRVIITAWGPEAADPMLNVKNN